MQAFSVGTCLGDSLAALVRARRTLLLLLAVAAPLIGVAIHVLTSDAPLEAFDRTERAVVLLPIVDVLLATIVTVAVVAALYDQQRSIGKILIATLRRALSAAFTMVLIYLVVFAMGFAAAIPVAGDDPLSPDLVMGLIMLVVWTLLSTVLYTRWFVAIPATVIEYLGPLGALRRSSALTRGHRTHLFAILALIGTLVISSIVVAELWLGARRDADALLFAIALLAWIPWSVFRAAVSATAYVQLRAETEALAPEHLADVFE